MRLKPVAPLIFLEANTDATVHGLAIPKGTAIFVASRAAATAPAAFPDPLAFKAERWLGDESSTTPGAALADTKRAFLPFGAGPRFCPRRNLAMIEIKHAIATIVRHFDIARDKSGHDVEERFSFVMMPIGLRLRLAPR